MLLNTAAFVAGAWWLQQQAALPSAGGAFIVAAIAALALVGMRSGPAPMRVAGQVLLVAACAGAGFYWAAMQAGWRLSDRLPAQWEGRDIRVVGVVAGLPERTARGWRFVFEVERTLTPDAYVPRRVIVSWFDPDAAADEAAVSPVTPGERWRFSARFKRPHASYNPHAFDAEAWLLERGIRATGYVRDTAPRERVDAFVMGPRYAIERLRARLRDRLLAELAGKPYAGVVVALTVGDQQSIPAAQWQVFTRTGVNHLMSISGLHVTMVSGLAFLIVFRLWRRSPLLVQHAPARSAAVLAGLVAALCYVLLAGFAVPAQRTLWMLGTLAFAWWLRVFATPSGILATALLVVLVLDPMAVLAAGFWLSFGAVTLLMYVTAGRVRREGWLLAWGRTQWTLFLGLAPLLLVLFQQVSLVAPVANAFAVPWVGLVVVPLSLLAAVIPWVPVADLAHATMAVAGAMLEFLSDLPAAAWTQRAPSAWAALLAVAGAAWLLLPRGFPARWIGLIAMLPLVALPAARPGFGEAWVSVLDVGQGLAAVVQTRSGALVFDTGPAWSSEADSGSRVIVPFLRGEGVRRLEGLIVSHDDADHSGGAASLLAAVPVRWVATPLPEGHAALASAHPAPCIAGQRWEWSGVRFDMLHPEADSYNSPGVRDNARSCVLKISTGGAALLMAADIEKDSERSLLARGTGLTADILVAPHHGSRTSSTPEFISAVQPNVTIFSVGYRNRFGHPAPDVVARYRSVGSRIVRTDEGGAIRVVLNERGWSLERWRDARPRYWHDR
ncbi:MAG: DNA internalization-related competence protein ComEC/Rec2 [Betaproteobacteria bacterium]